MYGHVYIRLNRSFNNILLRYFLKELLSKYKKFYIKHNRRVYKCENGFGFSNINFFVFIMHESLITGQKGRILF